MSMFTCTKGITISLGPFMYKNSINRLFDVFNFFVWFCFLFAFVLFVGFFFFPMSFIECFVLEILGRFVEGESYFQVSVIYMKMH